jgi:protein gp37
VGKTLIEWTDASWNPIVGCTEVSPGCVNCYAARLAATRLSGVPAYKDLAILSNAKPRWLGNVAFLPERLEEPLHWKKPRRIFVCDMGDLFHEDVEMWQQTLIFRTIKDCPQHTFQILTKRADRMWTYMRTIPVRPNVWLGVSVENQRFADERIPLLLETPAAVRFISAEPLLGLVHVRRWMPHPDEGLPRIDWVIAGGESGPHARPMHPDWPHRLLDQCQAAGVPFFFKQWGIWLHANQMEGTFQEKLDSISKHTLVRDQGKGDIYFKVGKKKAGRLLDGREWNEFPEVKHD